ncbi:MAG: DEAD/DEAH box helicase, partial [Bacteroidota bacterium]|nr:DEAD/DEAH box helicase [Bacteroidota bacterium]
VVQDFFKDKYFIGSLDIDLQIQKKTDWFDIHGTVRFDDFLIPFLKLRKHILNHIREYVLPNGEIAMIPEEWFARYYDIMQFSTANGETAKLKKHHYGLIYPFLEEVEKKKDFAEFIGLSDKKELTQPEIPKDLHANLRPYQAEGYTWLSYLQDLNLGGCLADDMGLGKTLQTIALLTASKVKKNLRDPQQQQATPQMSSLFNDEDTGLSRPGKTSLIVMPLSLICNWENEVGKFAPHLKLYKHTGSSRIQDADKFSYYDIVLTTYGIVRNDLELLKKFNFYYLILDESQAIKNPDSKIYHAISELSAQHRLVLSGTPIENSLSDLWAQMSFLNPGLLGNLKFFRNEFQVPIEKDNNENKQEKLKKLIAPFILRRTKALVEKDLPPLTEKVYYCEMSDEQKSLYETKKSEIRNSLLENLEEGMDNKTRFLVLKGLMQLRLLANHPALTDKQSLSESGKFDEVIRNIGNLISENHKVLVFSQFVKHLNLFRDYFEKQNWRYSYLTGAINGNNRQAIIDSFQGDPDNHLFLISLKAGGYGLNITAADYVFILDPWWNPASENQAISRAYRIGQKNKVMAYKFITKDSIEEKILSLQEKKSNLAEAFVSVNNPLHLFTSDELIGLFE